MGWLRYFEADVVGLAQLARDIQAESGALVACGEEGFEQIASACFGMPGPLSRSSRKRAAGFGGYAADQAILSWSGSLSKCRTALSHNTSIA